MKSILKTLMVITVSLSSVNSFAQIKNAQTDHTTATVSQNIPRLKAVFDNYFTLKDALIKTDANVASAIANTLLSAVNGVDMDLLSPEEHTVWMKVMKDVISDVERISKSKDISKQRAWFSSLSANMYELIKVSKSETPVYLQHCPMYNDGKGANWLSKENTVKNPYYGSQMLTCGKTVETIK